MSLPVLLSLFAALQLPPPKAASEPIDLMAEFDAVCLAWDGDPEEAANVAQRRSYISAQERVPDDLFQRSWLEVWTKSDGTREAMAITQKNYELTFGMSVDIKTCYVTLTPGDLRTARTAVRERLGFDGFLQEDTRIFAWTPSEDGGYDRIRRNTFERDFIRQMTDHGIRYISLAQHGDQVILGYVAPRDAPAVQAPSLID